MKKQFFLLILPALLMFTSCHLAPKSSGNPYEVMVVADDSVWMGYAGAALKDVLNKPMPMLPQEEPMFHVSHVEQKHYDRITNLFRNIIIINVSSQYTQAKMQIQRNVFSSPQLILYLNGPSEEEISMYVTEHTKDIIRLFSTEEINREATRLETEHNIKFDKKVEEMFGCHMNIPADLRKMKVGKDFIWASDDGLSSIQNICIYSYPYATERVFTRNAFIALRDTFMGRNIPGEFPNSKMATNREFTSVSDQMIRGHYTQVCRGLWEMTGEAMGGPYVSHSQVDTLNNRVIVVEGFVYAPDKMKRTMIRRLEAALYTLELPSGDVPATK